MSSRPTARRVRAIQAACFASLIFGFLATPPGARAQAGGFAPDELPGGALQILDDEGAVVGGCPLERTEVTARLVGYFGRTTVRQIYTNPLPTAIEAVYVFPLPENAAVDSLVMTIGERRIVGRVKERDEARQIYEAARDAGQVASLLDQERPNIFTQSVANIAPGATVEIEIGFVETIKYEDGAFHWHFPMVVGPRYIPGGGSAERPMESGKDTPQVPDGSKITPPIVPEGMRAGHTISLDVLIDPGVALAGIESASHAIEAVQITDDAGGPWRVSLAERDAIPNKDFVLKYEPETAGIGDAFFVHEDERGKFFALMLMPPTRSVTPADIQPRELIFVLDTSGSMSGQPIAQAKRVMDKLITGMQPHDRFNVITFAGSTRVLWHQPRPATPANIAAARALVDAQQGGGGTEMMSAINAALQKTELSVYEAVRVVDSFPDAGTASAAEYRIVGKLEKKTQRGVNGGDETTHVLVDPYGRARLALNAERVSNLPDEGWVRVYGRLMPTTGDRETGNADALIVATRIETLSEPPAERMRLVCFLTDGYVGNDYGILNAVRENAGATRVFSFGIGSSVNRFLLERMAELGRGKAEIVLLHSDAEQAGKQFYERLAAPVMKDVAIELIGGEVGAVYPEEMPDLYAVEPVMIVGKLDGAAPSRVRLTGVLPDGLFDRTYSVSYPEEPTDRKALASLWARRAVDALLTKHYEAVQQEMLDEAVKAEVVALGERYGIVSKYTSFVAVDEQITNIDGELVRVEVPVEMPEGVSYEGVFGQWADVNSMAFRGRKMSAAARGRGQAMFGGGRAGGGAPPTNAAPRLAEIRHFDVVSTMPAEAAKEARAEREAEQKLQKQLAKLAPELQKLLKAYEADADADLATPAREAGLRLSADGTRLYVAVTFKGEQSAVLAALRAVGFEPVPSTAEGLLLGTLPLEKLGELAALESVRRVGPLRVSGGGD